MQGATYTAYLILFFKDAMAKMGIQVQIKLNPIIDWACGGGGVVKGRGRGGGEASGSLERLLQTTGVPIKSINFILNPVSISL